MDISFFFLVSESKSAPKKKEKLKKCIFICFHLLLYESPQILDSSAVVWIHWHFIIQILIKINI